MTIDSYAEIRTHYKSYNMIVQLIKDRNNGTIPDQEKNGLLEWEREIKDACRDFYRKYDKYHPDPLSVPIRNDSNAWRSVSSNDGEYVYDFIIIKDNGQTYEELEEYIQDHCPYYYPSVYEFPTGRTVTLRTYSTRIPCGISIIHERGIDW